MKIGIVCYPTHGGSGVVASELAIGLAKKGHEVHIISYATPFRLRTFYRDIFIHEIEVATYPLFKYPPYELSLVTKLVEIAETRGLDIIHAHYAVPHAASAYLAKQILNSGRPKTVTTLHGTDITLVGQESSFFDITKFSIARSDEVTAVSEYLRSETVRAFGPVHPDLRVIPNFVNLSEYHPAANANREGLAPEGHKIISHTSNFREVKRVKDVVRIFARIRRAMPSTLLMIGDGPERGEAEREAQTLEVAGDVRFLGRLDRIVELMQATDLFLLPSQSESFGLAALEAMACGSPVVASRAGGLPEVVEDGVSGILEPVGSVEAMGRRAVELLRSPDKYRAMAKAAVEKAAEFSADRVVPMYEALYRETLG
jgi:N-acetyl-alpha-D-glucosaminyl L-malate synthase BshA